MSDLSVRVFCYGSNMCRQRLQHRIPVRRWLGTARVEHYQLRWHKRGADGSGKADCFYTGHQEDCVWGVVVEVQHVDRVTLDKIEGLGRGYAIQSIEAHLVTRPKDFSEPHSDNPYRLNCWAYLAMDSWIDERLKPFDWYHAYVVSGARQHRLPPTYVRAIEAQEVVSDPDLTRLLYNGRILKGTAKPGSLNGTG